MRTSLALVPSASLFALTALTACGAADLSPGSPTAELAYDAPSEPSPYEIELIGEGAALPTYAHNGRFYVLGQVGQRYAIRVKNTTPVRVEALISVDGLDVIDGETANTNKRGYVIAPHGQITIDGFRVSTSHVAAFRFSSVDDSYAGRKGKARNVGAIGVAIFTEQAQAELIVPNDRVATRDDKDYEYEDSDGDDYSASDRPASEPRRGMGGEARAKQAPVDGRRRPAPTQPSIDSNSTGSSAEMDEVRQESSCCGPRTNRPGLGTEYGERRYSAVGFTRFVRGSTEPTAYAELRYNNEAGLAALGITTGPGFDENELTRRETAEPFPGQRFSEPPQ